jgi:hypothetical protein
MAAVPAYANTHAQLPIGHVRPDGVDETHHLMTRNARISYGGNCTDHGEHVAVADAAGLNLDAHLARLGLGYVALDDFESGIGLGNLNGFHPRHGNSQQ